jgi:hypothetical protein
MSEFWIGFVCGWCVANTTIAIAFWYWLMHRELP